MPFNQKLSLRAEYRPGPRGSRIPYCEIKTRASFSVGHTLVLRMQKHSGNINEHPGLVFLRERFGAQAGTAKLAPENIL